MAFFPCDDGPHYNPRRNYLVYVGVGSGTEFTRWRLRFCEAHLSLIQEHLAQFKVNPEDGTVSGGDPMRSDCLSCSQPVDQTGRNVFLTCYPPKNEREDYWARIHVDHSLPDPLNDSFRTTQAS